MTISPQRGKILLKTIHGSTLYGTNHKDSDEDWYFITEHGKGRSYKTEDDTGKVIDYHVIGIKNHATKLLTGTPQALEAVFSTVAEVDPAYLTYFKSLRIYSSDIESTYRRTIKSLSLSEDSVKLRRHAIRLTWNLLDLRNYGRFNPTMTNEQLRVSKYLSETMESRQLCRVLKAYIDNDMNIG